MAEEGFRIIPNNQRPRHDSDGPIPVQFRKSAEIIWKLRGEGHLRFVLRCLKAHRGQVEAFKCDVLWALSDILAVRTDWVENDQFLMRVHRINLAALRLRHAARRPWPIKSGFRNDLMNRLEGSLNAPA